MLNNSPQVILLTGGLASGKTTVAKLLVELSDPHHHHIEIIDTDILAKSLLLSGNSCFDAVLAHFGKDILFEDSSKPETLPEINRRKLREIIFNSPEEKQWLEKLLHPKIRELALSQAAQLKNKPEPPEKIIIVIPLLASKNIYPADKIITVESPPSLQIERVMLRDNISQELATKIIESQPSSEQRQKIADIVLWNTGDMELLRTAVLMLLREENNKN